MSSWHAYIRTATTTTSTLQPIALASPRRSSIRRVKENRAASWHGTSAVVTPAYCWICQNSARGSPKYDLAAAPLAHGVALGLAAAPTAPHRLGRGPTRH